MSPCCVGKLKFSIQGGTSFGAESLQWRWRPRMAGSVEDITAAGNLLLAAAGGAGTESEAVPGTPLIFDHIQHPRSQALLQLLPDPDRHYRLLAQVADTIFDSKDEEIDASLRPTVVDSTRVLIERGAFNEEAGSEDDERKVLEREVARVSALCILAKLHVELDRNESAREKGYAVGVFRMLHAGRMAKGDLIVGLPVDRTHWSHLFPLLQQPDI